MEKSINLKHGQSTHPLYHIWHNMRERCLKERSDSYKHYGERGILICPEWEDFVQFFTWAINNGYKKGLSIDRIDVNGNYTPENCKFSTTKEQANNRRKRIAEIKTFCTENGLMPYYNSITSYLRKGKSREWILNRYKYI